VRKPVNRDKNLDKKSKADKKDEPALPGNWIISCKKLPKPFGSKPILLHT
jgi:hypothetical protein